MDNAQESNTKPIQVFRLRGVSASVFANTAQTASGETTFHKVSLQRTYKDGQAFKQTPVLGRDDLPIAALLLQKAWEFVLETEADAKSEG